jgi:hypothetical protein
MRLWGVPSERVFLLPGRFPGFAPWVGMRCPSEHGIGNVADGLTSPVDEGRRTKNPCLVAQFEFNLSDRCFCSRLQAEFL